jgi:hypothetical protein
VNYSPGVPYVDAWTATAALGAVTSRIRLLAAVLTGFWHPWSMAHAAATLDHFTGGRVELNVITGARRAGPSPGRGVLFGRNHLTLSGGEGGAWMRIIVDAAQLRRATEVASAVTHAHPLGIEGASLVARTVAMALAGAVDLERLKRTGSGAQRRFPSRAPSVGMYNGSGEKVSMKKVNVSLDEEVRDELFRLVPPRQRSRVVNEALREVLLRRRRVDAMARLVQLRGRSATLGAAEILTAVRRDRARRG